MTKKPQSDKFKALAREVACDDDEVAFDKKLSQISNAKNLTPAKTTKKRAAGAKRKK